MDLSTTQELSHLPYSSFLAVLDDVAIQHPDVRRLADSAAATALEESVVVLAAPADPAKTLATKMCPNNESLEIAVSHPENGPGTLLGSRPGTRNDGERPDNRSPSGRNTANAGLGNKVRAEQSRAPGSSAHQGRKIGGKNKVTDAKVKSPRRRGEKPDPTTRRAGVVAGEPRTAATSTTPEPTSSAAGETVPTSGFRPDDQRLLVLLQKYILVKSTAGKEVGAWKDRM